jgi:hypothetical protein
MGFKQFKSKSEKAYDEFIDRMSSISSRRNFVLTTIGLVNDLDVYTVVVNPKATRTIAFVGGIHGDEVAGPHAVLKFLDEARMPKDVRVWTVPLVNPWGFIHGTRNAERINLNRQFNKRTFPRREAGLLQKAAEKYSTKFLHSIHEDDEAKGFYLYYQDKSIKKLCKELVEIAEKHMLIDERKSIYDEKLEAPGLIFIDENKNWPRHRNSFEGLMWRRGAEYVCTETPMKLPVKKRVECQCDVMKHILKRFADPE